MEFIGTHGRAVVDAVDLALQSVQHDRNGSTFVANHLARIGERRCDGTARGAGHRRAAAIGP